MSATILIGDVRAALRTLAADSVQCVVTSPPYWGLRSYLPDDHPAKGDELGLEATPDEYITNMVEVFREVRRVLRPDGTLWLNIGDSYCTSPRGIRPSDSTSTLDSPGYQEEKPRPTTRTARDIRHTPKRPTEGPSHDPKWPGARDRSPGRPNRSLDYGLKHKDMVGIPWMLAFALRADGWWLRMDIIWHKPNPMPESVTDRPTKSHEYLFLLTKSPQYYYDATAIRELASYGDHPRNGTPDLPDIQAPGQPRQSGLTKLRRAGNKRDAAGRRDGDFDARYEPTRRRKVAGKNSRANADRTPRHGTRKQDAIANKRYNGFNERWDAAEEAGTVDPGTRNSRSVWTIATHPYPEAHFATFPPALAERCILAGTSAMGCCPTCAAPLERIEEVAYVNPGNRTTNGPRSTERRHETAGFEVRLERDAVTVGWMPTCECEVPETGLPGCTVLDPFNGAGTAGLVALRLQRQYLGIDLYEQYGELAARRISDDAPLLNRVSMRRVFVPSNENVGAIGAPSPPRQLTDGAAAYAGILPHGPTCACADCDRSFL